MSELAKALADLQAELPRIDKGSEAKVKTKTGADYSYKYAGLDVVSEAVLPLLSKHRLSFTCCPTMSDHGFILDYALTHESGEMRGGQYPLPDPARCSPQEIGSAITYGRRYSLMCVTGLVTVEDDDGQSASNARSSRPSQERLQDSAFLDDVRTRVDLSTTLLELDAIETEAKRAFSQRRIDGTTAREAKEYVDNRRAELTAPV